MSELDNTYYILSKTTQPSVNLPKNVTIDDNVDLHLMFSTSQVQKSFYNKSVRTKLKLIYPEHNYLSNVDETGYRNTITMDLTSNLFVLIIINIKH